MRLTSGAAQLWILPALSPNWATSIQLTAAFGGSTILLWSLMPKYLPLLSRLPIRSQQPNEVDYDKGASPCTLLRAKKETATSGCHHSPPHPQPPTPNPNPTPGTLLNMVINGKCCPCFLLVCFVCQLQNHQKMIIDTTCIA